MKTKINVMIMIVLMLVAMCTSVAFAETSIPIDDTHEAADYFPNVSLSALNEGDLGDESTPIDYAHEAADYFPNVSLNALNEGDLGDESTPIYLLVGLAALVMAGTVVVHKKRKSIQ